jgi:hypothetical protein
LNVFPALPFYVAGFVILHRVGSHPSGWLLLGIGATLQITAFESLPWLSTLWVNWVQTWGFTAMFAMFTWLLITFPEPTASPAWRGVGWAATVLILGGVMTPTITDIGDSTITLGPNPTGLRWLPEFTSAASNIVVTGLLVSAAAGVVVRGRRAGPEIRPRYKPVLAAMTLLGVFIGALIFALVLDPTFADDARYGGIVWSVALVLYMLIPASFGVAITRYRLYDIDKVVSRTATYALVAAVVGAVYTIPVVTLPVVLGESNDLVVAGSTLAAAAAFNPARRRIKRAVDHRFNRATYDAEQHIASVAASLESGCDLAAIRAVLSSALRESLAPAGSSLWVAEHEPSHRSLS